MTQRAYSAFISYCHRDEKWAAWLHRKLETYRGHKRLVGTPNRFGLPVPERLFPVFRDREELEGAPDLPGRIQEALLGSRTLVVVCSPGAAASRWVNEEIKAFKALQRENQILALIISGEPNASDGADAAQECFPPALRYQLGADGVLSAQRTEPLAADARKDKDGKRGALLKIAAGILGVPLDTLRQRDAQRRQRVMALSIGVLATVALVMAGLAAYAFYQERTATAQRLAAESRFQADTRYDLSLLLATAAVQTRDNAQTRSALLSAVMRQPYRAAQLTAHADTVSALAFSADGRMLATGADDERVVLWLEQNGRWSQQRTLAAGDDVTSLALSPDGRVLAVVYRSRSGERLNSGIVSFWDVASGMPIRDPAPVQETLWSVQFTPDGQRLLGADGDGRSVVWDIASGQVASETETGNELAGANVALRADPLLVAGGGQSGEITFASAGAVTQLPVVHEGEVSGLAFSSDGALLVTGDANGGVVVWDSESRTPRSEATPARIGAIYRIAFVPGTHRLAIGGEGGTVVLWDADANRTIRTVFNGGEPVWKLAFTPDGARLAIGLESGKVFVADLREGEALGRQAIVGDSVWDVRFRAPHTLLAATGEGLKEIDLAAAGLPATIVVPGHAWDVAASRDGQTFATRRDCNDEGLEPPTEIVLVRATENGGAPAVVAECSEAYAEIALHPDGAELAVARLDGTVEIRAAADGWKIRSTLGTPTDLGHSVDALVFSNAGDLLALGRRNGAAEIFRWSDLTRLRDWQANPEGIVRLAFSPDGTLLAAGNQDRSATLWSVVTGERYGDTLADLGDVADVTFTRDGTTLATAADDAVILWDVQTQQPLSERIGTHESLGGLGTLNNVAFGPNGDYFVTAGFDGQLFTWGFGVAAWIRHACYVANRDLSSAEREFYGLGRGTGCPAR